MSEQLFSEARRAVVCVALYSFDIGGSELLGVRLIEHYQQAGLKVCCVSTRCGNGPLEEKLKSFGVDCCALALDSMSRWRRFIEKRRLADWLSARNVTMLHAHHFSVLSDLMPAARRLKLRPIVVTEHTSDVIRDSSAHRRLARKLAPLADHVVAINDEVQKAIAEVSSISMDDVELIENGIDVDTFSPNFDGHESDSVTVGWLGRLHPDKDVLTGIRAFAQASKVIASPVRLIIAGDGQLRGDAEAEVKRLGIDANVEFWGEINNTPHFLRSCDIFMMSSASEGTPLALLEAMAVGLPIVATNVGGIPNTVTTDCALLAPPRDPEALGHLLVTLFSDRERIEVMGRNARQHAVAHFAEQRMVEKYIELLAGHGTR